METTTDDSSQFSTRLQQYAMLAWYNLASPKLTGALVAVMLLATGVGLLLPQQPAAATGDGSLWIASLPAILQLRRELLYFLGLFVQIDPGLAFTISIILSGLALFGLGAAKVLITERNWLRSGLEMLVVGGVAAGAAYLVGFALQGLGA